MTAVVFWLLAVPAVAAGLLVFRLASMARVTYALLAVFLFVGGLLILLGLAYLGAVVILMMVIEMVIMAVFMVDSVRTGSLTFSSAGLRDPEK